MLPGLSVCCTYLSPPVLFGFLSVRASLAVALRRDLSQELPSYFCRFLWDGLYDVYYPPVPVTDLRE